MTQTATLPAKEIKLDRDSAELALTYDRISDRQFGYGKQIVHRLGVGPGHKVLDVGAGTGRLADHIKDVVGPNGQVHGIEPLPLRVDIARKRLGKRAGFEVGNAEDLSRFADGSFDAVVFNAVYHWLPEKDRPLSESLRVLRQGGKIGITTGAAELPNQLQKIAQGIFERGRIRRPASQLFGSPHRVTSSELREQLLKAGFRVVSIEVRSFVDRNRSPQDIFDFSESSSFGNFLSSLPREEADDIRLALTEELESLRTPEGIPLERHNIFAIAQKP
jgi:arsenite methyltransferase